MRDLSDVGRWITSTNEVSWPSGPTYSTREQAILHAAEDLDLPPGDQFWSGQIREPRLPEVDAWRVIECAMEDLSNQVGEFAETWPDETNEQRDQLGKRLTEVFHAWVEEHDLHPTCFSVEDVEVHLVHSEAVA